MRLEALQTIAVAGESSAVEFKKSTAQLSRAGKTLCGFLNAPPPPGQSARRARVGKKAIPCYQFFPPVFNENTDTITYEYRA